MPRRRWRVLRMAPMLTSNAPDRWNQCHASVVKLNASEPPTVTTAAAKRNPFEVTIQRNANSRVNQRRLRQNRLKSLAIIAFECCVRGSAIVPPIVFSVFDLTEPRSYDPERFFRLTSPNGLMKCLSVATYSDSGCFSRIIFLIISPEPFLE